LVYCSGKPKLILVLFSGSRSGGSDGDEGRSVALDGSGNTYVTGLFFETVDFDPGPGQDNHTSNGSGDVFLSKFNLNGESLWTQTWGGSTWDRGRSVDLDGSGNAFVTGSFTGKVDFDPSNEVDFHISNGNHDVFLSKFDSSGSFIWAPTWGGQDWDTAHSVAIDGLGNAYVTGYFKSTVDFNPGPSEDFLTANGDFDVFLSKFHPDGCW